MHRGATAVVLGALALFSCGDSPDHADCLNACAAQNQCPGAMQENCTGLCNARPKDCTNEYTTYWTCAGTHLTEACGTAGGTCADAFGKYSVCITAYCLAYPLDSSCYY
jgi:hypothetical protein